MEGTKIRVHVFSPATLGNTGQRSELQKGVAHPRPPLSQGLQTPHSQSLESCGKCHPSSEMALGSVGALGQQTGGYSVRGVQHLIIFHTSPQSARGRQTE